MKLHERYLSALQLTLFPSETPALNSPKATPPPAPGKDPSPAKKGKLPLADQIRAIIGPRLPEGAVGEVVRIVESSPVSIIVTRERTSKSGDYRPAHRNRPPRITVNGNLNPYAFLVTLVHEVAHHHVDLEFARSQKKFSLRRKSRPLPHGDEWKSTFSRLMKPFLDPGVFPDDILPSLTRYLENPKASSTADHRLSRALKRHDPPDNTRRLEELPFNAEFSLHGRRFFRKKEKQRTRFRCICLQTGREYMVSAHAPVEPLAP